MNHSSNNNARGVFHYNTEGMAVPSNVRKVAVDASSLRRLPRGVFSEQARMYQLEFVSSSSSSMLHEIGDHAFYKCRIMTAFHPPPTVTVIGTKALYGCAALMNVTLPNQLKRIHKGAFSNCKLLDSIRIPGSVEVIGSEAFSDCNSLYTLLFEEGCLRIIEDQAFARCGSLSSLTTPPSLEIIGNEAFERCYCISHANLAPQEARLTTIGAGAFTRLNRMENLLLPDTLESIGESAFAFCEIVRPKILSTAGVVIGEGDNETSIRITRVQLRLGISSRGGKVQLKACAGLLYVGNKCFQACHSLASFSIPPTVETLPISILHESSSIIFVELPEGLRMIQARAFEFCFRLLAIRIPSTVTAIGEHAFSECLALVSVIIPKNLQSLGDSAFYKCLKLWNIYLPPDVSSSLLASQLSAFSECKHLISMYGEGQSQIVRGLANRFKDLPIHERCYYSPYDDGQEINLTDLQTSITPDLPLVDSLGMTPCHILACSANGVVGMDLFQTLVDACPVIPLLCRMDHAKQYVLDYLYTNISGNAQQLEQLVFETILVRRIGRLGRHHSWRNRVEEACSNLEDQSRLLTREFHKELHNAYQLLENYESFVEMAVLLELAMWKKALASNTNDVLIASAEHREHYRVISGPDIVVDSVMSFLKTP